MMLKGYPEYKDSGLAWLGNIPKHWKVGRLKQICHLAYGDSLPDDVRLAGEVPVYGSNGQVGFHLSANTLSPCIVIGRKGSFGKVNYSFCPVFAIDTTFFVDSRFTKADIRWLFYILIWAHLDAVSKDAAVPGLNRGEAYAQLIPYCPQAEQQHIANYLDAKTRQINRFIRSKQQLINLLTEQKQAVINQAVTRGIDPNVRLKPSGIDWLGDIPEHWIMKPLKHWVKINTRVLPESTDPNYEFLYLDISAVSTGFLVKEPEKMLFGSSPSRARRILSKGDIIISTVRTYLKAIYFVKEDLPNYIASTGFAVLTPNKEIYPKFLSYVIQSRSFIDSVTANSVGVAYPAIAETKLAMLHLAIPRDFIEQQAIVKKIENEISPLEKAINRALREIDLIREYRTRLISDVVTGKIDVRDISVEPTEGLEGYEELDMLEEADKQEEEIKEIEEDL
ncbi:MAG: restriction endonuclease subunit S [bacterium]